MKTAYINGNFYLESGSFAKAVLVENGRFVKVGTADEILAVCEKTPGPGKESHIPGAVKSGMENFCGDDNPPFTIIDCEGRTVIPGINDSHCHVLMVAKNYSFVPLAGCRSIDEVIERSRAFLAAHPDCKGLSGMGWNLVDFVEGEKRNLTRQDLDKISTEIPISFMRACLHVLVCNTKALELAGVDSSTPQTEGGFFEVDETGRPTGLFAENAKDLITPVIPEPSVKEIEDNFFEVMKYAASLGITSVQSNDPGTVLPADEVLSYILKLRDEGKLTLRYHAQNKFESPKEFKVFMETWGASDRFDDMVSLGQLKLFKDGSIGGHSALMRAPYLDEPDNFGVEVAPDEVIDAFIQAADAHGVPVACHCIGDRAIEKLMTSYEKILKNGKNPLRHAIVHSQIMDQEMIRRMAADGLLAIVQPVFLHSDLHVLPSRISDSLEKTSNAYKSLKEAGVIQAFGTDSPVEDLNPFRCIYCAVTRKDLNGQPEKGYFPEECLTVAEAVDCYTKGSAYAQFMEHKKGRIKEGYLADMAVLSKNIFTCNPDEIKDIVSVMTVVGGNIVYRA